MNQARLWFAGAMLAALAWMAFQGGRSGAGDEDKIHDAVLKIAAAIKAGEDDDARKEAVALAKKIEDIEDVMDFLKPRKKDKKGRWAGGIGVGDKPGAIRPDGIELKLRDLGIEVYPEALAREAAALEEMAYVTAAIAEVALARPDNDPKRKKAWLQYAKSMREGAGQLALAAKLKARQEVHIAAITLNNSCTNCHKLFK